MKAKKTRTYVSATRTESLIQTKRQVLDSSLKLFSKRGIDDVTISEIAAAGGVSVAMVYSVYKSKAGILRSLMDEAILGEDYQAAADKLSGVSDPIEMLSVTANIARTIYDSESKKIGLLRGASAFSRELANVEKEFEKFRYQVQEARIEALFKSNLIKPHLDRVTARQIMWMYTGRDVYRLLVIESGWSSEKFENWLATTLIESLTDQRRFVDASRLARHDAAQ